MTRAVRPADRYGPPSTTSTNLKGEPRLTSWDIAGSRSQTTLADSLAQPTELLKAAVAEGAHPLGVLLDVHLNDARSWLTAYDLDNYLYPLAHHARQVDTGRFVSFRATKRLGEAPSTIRIGPVERDASATAGWRNLRVMTTGSAEKPVYKQSIHQQLVDGGESALGPGPVELDLAFRVGPSRNWLNLWKPTIDALGPLLGATSQRPWNPDDGRVANLALHCAVDQTLRYEVHIAILARLCPDRDEERMS